MATKQGALINLGNGNQFRLVVEYAFTNSAIKIKPTVAMAASGHWGKKRKVVVRWKGLTGGFTAKSTKAAVSTFKYWNFSVWRSIGSYEATVEAVIGGKISRVNLTSNLKPPAPTVVPQFVNDNRTNIVVSNSANKGVFTTSVLIERQDGISTASWEQIGNPIRVNTNGAYSVTFTDQTTERGAKYRYRARATNDNGTSGNTNSSWYYTNPGPASDVGHTRVDNHKNTVTFRRSGQDVDRSIIDGFVIERSDSGSVWKEVGTCGPGSPDVDTVTYTDETCTTNEYYSYRVRPTNPRGVSPQAYDEEGTEPTYNTPAAPAVILATMTASGQGLLELINGAKTADTLYIERSDDGGATWSALDEVEEGAGAVTTYTDETGISGENVQYRARNGRSELPVAERYSAWCYSNVVSTLKKPAAPTITAPANDTPVMLDNETVHLVWIHNPNDGTAETAAQVQYAINGSYVATITLGDVMYYDLTLDPARFSANDVVTWRVRTKGQHSSYSDWCGYNSFVVRTRPQIAFTAPENGATVTNLPLALSWQYSDESGTLASLTLEIRKDNKTKKTISIPVGTGESGTYTYSLSEYLFDNESTYDLRVTAVSSTGLSSIQTISVYTEYTYVTFSNGLMIDATFDEDTGAATLALNLNEADMSEDEGVVIVDSPVESAYIYRVVDGNRTLIAEDLHEGDQFIDKYAPVNIPVTYELLQRATTGEISLISQDYEFYSQYWYLLYGTDHEKIARAIYNPAGDISLSRPEMQQIRYSGRKYPVTYDSHAIEEKYNFSGIATERDELQAFIEMMRDGGQGVWKSGDGEVYAAAFDFSYSADFTYTTRRWEISLEVTRIDSEGL